MTWGLGAILLLFYSGVVLGAVAADYVAAHQTTFLLGWLLPHGSIDIPAILIAGQALFLRAGALIGWGRPIPRTERLRVAFPDVVALVVGFGVLLMWAGVVEAFISQGHRPVLAYSSKIAFGVMELAALGSYLLVAGRQKL